jgi:hypothetical protein
LSRGGTGTGSKIDRWFSINASTENEETKAQFSEWLDQLVWNREYKESGMKKNR